jgi:type IV secretory pathway protease TraF
VRGCFEEASSHEPAIQDRHCDASRVDADFFASLRQIGSISNLECVGERSYRALPWRYIDKLEVAQFAVVRPPPTLANLLEEGGYLPRGVPLIKRVLGLAGQTICRADLTVTVDEINVGSARERDHSGRKLPTWQGCHKLTASEVFLMNGDEPASLDGRYFGPLPVSSIIGRAEPLWISTENR